MKSEPNLASKPEAINKVIEMVTQCFNSLNVYGKTSDQLPGIIKMFILVLADYPLEKISKGFADYLKRNSVMPTPADIVNIIDPPKEQWKPDWSVYRALKKKVQQDGYYLYGSERLFVEKCENFVFKKAIDDDADAETIEAHKIASGLINFYPEIMS